MCAFIIYQFLIPTREQRFQFVCILPSLQRRFFAIVAKEQFTPHQISVQVILPKRNCLDTQLKLHQSSTNHFLLTVRQLKISCSDCSRKITVYYFSYLGVGARIRTYLEFVRKTIPCGGVLVLHNFWVCCVDSLSSSLPYLHRKFCTISAAVLHQFKKNKGKRRNWK